MDFLVFLALLKPTEQAGIAASTDPQVRILTLMAAGAGQIRLADPVVIAAVDYCVTVGLLTAPRAAAILAGTPPI